MTAFKNHLMMAEEQLNEAERTLKRLKIKSLDAAYPPIGHLYSVMVEELKIDKPDFQGFIDKLNEYIKIGGNGFACIKNKDEKLYSRTAHKFQSYLEKEWEGIPHEVFQRIMKEACGRSAHR